MTYLIYHDNSNLKKKRRPIAVCVKIGNYHDLLNNI